MGYEYLRIHGEVNRLFRIHKRPAISREANACQRKSVAYSLVENNLPQVSRILLTYLRQRKVGIVQPKTQTITFQCINGHVTTAVPLMGLSNNRSKSQIKSTVRCAWQAQGAGNSTERDSTRSVICGYVVVDMPKLLNK